MMDLSLFDKESNTKLTLLAMLFKKNGWYSIDQLVVDSKYDRNTLLKYSKLLQSEIETVTFSGTKARIEHSKNSGLRFYGNKLSYRDILYQLVEESFSFSLLRDLLLKNEVSIDQFSSEHFVSESSIRRKLTQFNQVFKNYGFSFRTTQRQITCRGNELQLRNYGYFFFWGIYRGVSWPFKMVSEEKVIKIISEQFSVNNTLTHVSVSRWSYIIAFNIHRFNTGNQLTDEDLPDFTDELNSQFPNYSTFMKAFRKAFHFTAAENNYLILLTQTASMFYMIENFFILAMSVHKKMNTAVFQLYQHYFSVVNPDLSQINETDQKLYRSLILAIFLAITLFPNQKKEISGYDYFSFLSRRYPNLVRHFTEKFNLIQEKTAINLSPNKEFLIASFCENYGLIGNATDFEPPIRIKLETDLPAIMESLLAKQLTSTLEAFFRISFISPISTILDENYELVIATTSSSTLKQIKEIPIVFINPEIYLIDVKNIVGELEKLRNKKKTVNING